MAEGLGGEVGSLCVRAFPDGETYVRLEDDPRGRPVILCCTLHRPDIHVLPLLFAARTALDLGASSVGLVAPYLAYMRQDARFLPGEAITSSLFAELLSVGVDWLVTVDPHLHRRRSLAEIYSIPAVALSAVPLVAEWIHANVDHPVLVGPDAESAQWIERVAPLLDAPSVVLEKTRTGDREVTIASRTLEACAGRTPVLVDDIVSTGQTIAQTVRLLRQAGLRAPACIAIHAVFAKDAAAAIESAGAGRLVTTSTIAHRTNAIDVTALLVEGARRGAGLARRPAGGG